MSLPDLGVGLVHLPGLEALFRRVRPAMDVIEVEPQTFWSHLPSAGAGSEAFRVNRDVLERARRIDLPLLVHSIGFPVGGWQDGDRRHLAALRETFSILRPAWWSEHLSFVAVHAGGKKRHLGFLMPPVQSGASIAVIVDRIQRLQDEFGLPFAFETGVNYLQPRAGEIPDGAFWGEIADRADCGILLDLHNIWANGLNGRPGLAQVADRLPLDRVWEVHLAGGQWHKGYWLDSHSGLPPEELIDAASHLAPRLPALHAILLEIIPDQIEARKIGEDEIAACLARLRCIWGTRGSAAAPATRRAPVARETDALPAMEDWEVGLEAAVRRADAGASRRFEGDPGLEIYRDLIAMVRRGTVVEALPLTMRYLRRGLGEAGLDRAFAGFWRRCAPEPFMSEEARNFGEFVRMKVALPHLDEVMAFELAGHRAAITGQPQYVTFTCAPEPVLSALKHGAPLEFAPMRAEVEVTPPAGA